MSIQNRNAYRPEIRLDFEAQRPIGEEPRLIEVRENLYEDRETTWYEYVPASYRPDMPIPLVLQMHGGGGDGLRDALETDWHRVAEEKGFLVVYPTSYRYGRWECDDADIETIRRLILRVCQRYAVDTGRIYMQGISNGDMITTAFALEHPEMLAAAGFVVGALPKEMLPHLPRGSLPCIQLRGEKDVRFGQRMDFDTSDVYAPKSQMNDYNRRMWMEANHATGSPEVYLRGKDNVIVYRGDPCDVIYWEIKDMGHRYPALVPSAFWEYCYSGWAKRDGKSVRLRPDRLFQPEDQFVLAVGGRAIYRQGKTLPLTTGGDAQCLLVRPAHQEEDPFYDVGEMLLTPAVYAPVEALALGLDCRWEVDENGRTALLRDGKGITYRFYNDSTAVFLNDEMHALKKPCFHRYGLFFVPVVEVVSELFDRFTAETDGVVAVSSKPVELSRGAARVMAHQLGAPARYPEPVIAAEDFMERGNGHVQ